MKRLIALALCVALASIAPALEINRGQDGYETPVAALESIRDSTSAAADTAAYNALMPYTLEFWAPQESDLANLEIWLHGLHTNGDSTYAKTCQDTLRIVRVYR